MYVLYELLILMQILNNHLQTVLRKQRLQMKVVVRQEPIMYLMHLRGHNTLSVGIVKNLAHQLYESNDGT